MPLDPNPQSVPVVVIAWSAFKLAMLTNKAYQRVSSMTTDQRAVSRLEGYFTAEVENWPVAAMFWQQMMTGCAVPLKPTADEAGGWRVIAEKANMPFSFSEAGDFQIKQ